MKVDFDSEKGDFALFIVGSILCCLLVCVTIYDVVLICVRGQEATPIMSEKASK